jgi:hypothetical protein
LHIPDQSVQSLLLLFNFPNYVNSIIPFADHTFIHLGYHDLIKIFSVLPAVVLQTKDNPSDIDGGTGGLKTEWLVDSVLERVALLEGKMKDAAKFKGEGHL